jgi:hypothetical protein
MWLTILQLTVCLLLNAIFCTICRGADPKTITPYDQPPEAPTTPEALQLLGISGSRPVREMLHDRPGWFNQLPPPNGSEDPIDPLGETNEALITKGLKAKTLTAFIDGYVDRIEHYYDNDKGTNKELIDWLAKNPAIRRDFWLAISPQFDDAAGAMRVLNDLRQHNAKGVEK